MTSDPAPAIALSHLALPDPTVEALPNAVVVPMEEGRNMAHGAFRNDGSFCELSRTLYSQNRFTGTPQASAAQNHLRGRYLFCGIGRYHFGHFLLECLPRLWALDHVRDVDGLMIVPMHGMDFNKALRRRYETFLNLFTGGIPVHLVTKPVQVGELVMPSQGMGHQNWTVGTPVFRSFVRSRLSAALIPDGPERLYVSRSGLKHARQRIDQEDRIEELMQDHGYKIFHPQAHKIAVQCQRYMAARSIVGGDGSAFHLAPFALQSGSRIGLIQRRVQQYQVDAIANQISAFAPVDLVRLDPLCRTAEGKALAPADPEGAQPVNFDSLKAQLEEAQLI